MVERPVIVVVVGLLVVAYLGITWYINLHKDEER